MSQDDTRGRGKRPAQLEGSLKSAQVRPHGLELVLRLRNDGDRALHYISDVRALHYDPVARRLTVRLTDEGRVVIPGLMSKIPQFRVVDPHSDAETSIELPEKIVKLASSPAPSGEVALEEHRIADAAEIEVSVAWADTPFYQDPRDRDDQRMPAARWQQGNLRVSHKMETRPRGVR